MSRSSPDVARKNCLNVPSYVRPSAADKKLHFAELVRTNADIEEFYRKYGLENDR